MKEKLLAYYQLTKPGIVRGNVITATAGFLFGAQNYDNILSLLLIITGVSFVVASACVLNNIFDMSIDKKMPRTKKRPLLTGRVSVKSAQVYWVILLILGLAILYVSANALAMAVALFGWVAYVYLYTFSKRVTVHGTLIGSISGATPPVIGYTAATNMLDFVALSLFAILVVWQMPHFYAIAIYRVKEYQAARIPVWSAVYSKDATRRQMIAYGLLFVPVSLSLWLFPITSYSYVVIMGITSVWWLTKILPYPENSDYDLWAKRVFRSSLKVLLIFSLAISLNALLP